MKVLNCQTKNINSPIVAKVTMKSILRKRKRKNYFFVQEKLTKDKDYAAQIIKNSNIDELKIDSPVAFGLINIEDLNEGDIIMLHPDGRIEFLFEQNEPFNPILVTNRCNANCIACPQPQVQSETDRTQLNLKIISLIDKNATTIGITGGEPSLLGDEFLTLMRQIKKSLSNTNILLLTNGIKFSDYEFVKELYKIGNKNLQIDIPIFSDTDSDHNKALGAKGFYKMIQGLYNLATLNFKIGLRIVVQKDNYKRLPQIAEFIYHNFPFVYHIAFIQMEIYGNAIKNINNIWIDPYDYNTELDKAVKYLNNREMSVSIYNSQLCILPKTVWKYSKISISAWKSVYLDFCNECIEKDNCGGVFSTSNNMHSKHLNAIKD